MNITTSTNPPLYHFQQAHPSFIIFFDITLFLSNLAQYFFPSPSLHNTKSRMISPPHSLFSSITSSSCPIQLKKEKKRKQISESLWWQPNTPLHYKSRMMMINKKKEEERRPGTGGERGTTGSPLNKFPSLPLFLYTLCSALLRSIRLACFLVFGRRELKPAVGFYTRGIPRSIYDIRALQVRPMFRVIKSVLPIYPKYINFLI